MCKARALKGASQSSTTGLTSFFVWYILCLHVNDEQETQKTALIETEYVFCWPPERRFFVWKMFGMDSIFDSFIACSNTNVFSVRAEEWLAYSGVSESLVNVNVPVKRGR